MSGELSKKFTPKRRAPYLLQQEIIQKNKEVVLVKPKKDNINLILSEVNQDVLSDDIEKYDSQFQKVTGIQKRLLDFFIKCCINNKSCITGPLILDNLSSVGGTTKKTLKTIITRMIQKGIIKKVDTKKGRGGFIVLSVDKRILNMILKKI